MEFELELPEEVPVMTLRGAVLFPQAAMPLHIFEPRYRQMLADVLDSHRLFAIVQEREDPDSDEEEPPHQIGTVGMVRLCHKNEDGSANLVLQGLVRVRVLRIVRENPYRLIAIHPLKASVGQDAGRLDKLQAELTQQLVSYRQQGGEVPDELLKVLRGVDDPEIFVDLSCSMLCQDTEMRQSLLDTLDISERYQRFQKWLNNRSKELALIRHLKTDLGDGDVELN